MRKIKIILCSVVAFLVIVIAGYFVFKPKPINLENYILVVNFEEITPASAGSGYVFTDLYLDIENDSLQKLYTIAEDFVVDITIYDDTLNVKEQYEHNHTKSLENNTCSVTYEEPPLHRCYFVQISIKINEQEITTEKLTFNWNSNMSYRFICELASITE